MSDKPTRGIDHVGITVRNLDAASRFFEQAFDAMPLYDNITRSQSPMQGPKTEQQLDLAHGTVLITMRMMKLASGPGLELFQIKGPDQQRPARFRSTTSWRRRAAALYGKMAGEPQLIRSHTASMET